MKLTQEQLFDIIKDLKPDKFKLPELGVLTNRVATILEVKPCNNLHARMKVLLKDFKRHQNIKSRKSSLDRTKILDSTVLDSDDYQENDSVEMSIENQSVPPKKNRKEFHDLSNRMKRDRTQPIADLLSEYVESEGLTMSELLGYLMHRMLYKSNRRLANIGTDIFEGTFEDKSYDLDEAIAMMHTLMLSKHQMRQMKVFLKSKGIHFPSTTELLDARKALRPVISSVLDGKGVSVDYTELVQTTVQAQLDVVSNDMNNEEKELLKENLKMIFKDGCDGAGQQVKWKSKTTIDAAENMFQYGLVALQIKSGESTLWKNPVPNSPNCLRPVYLIREKESDEEMMNLVIVATDTARNNLNKNGVKVMVNGTEVIVEVEIKDTMKDLKLKKSISGLGGADCILCKTKQSDWTDLSKIEEGFSINRSNEDTVRLYNELISKSNTDEIQRCRNDFNVREGITKCPLTTSDQHSITITHSYINVTTWFLKVLYRLNSEYFVWTESQTVLGEHIRKGKERVFDGILSDTGLCLDVVCSGGAKGGTSTDGKQGRRFFSEEVVCTLKRLTKEKYHEKMLRVHALLSAIMRVVSSQQHINLVEYVKYCKELSVLIASYRWVKINHTLHGLIHHSAELIERNDGFALGSLSEEGLEATNKFIRRFLELLSRKTCPIDQMRDVMGRLLERSNPHILAKSDTMKKRKQPKKCLHCDSTSHTSRSHKKFTSFGPQTYYNQLVDSMIIEDENE